MSRWLSEAERRLPSSARRDWRDLVDVPLEQIGDLCTAYGLRLVSIRFLPRLGEAGLNVPATGQLVAEMEEGTLCSSSLMSKPL